jgi:hypothetical protein
MDTDSEGEVAVMEVICGVVGDELMCGDRTYYVTRIMLICYICPRCLLPDHKLLVTDLLTFSSPCNSLSCCSHKVYRSRDTEHG